MRLPDAAHTARPWRIHELTDGFRLEDVWALPTPGGPDDFDRLVRIVAGVDLAHASGPVRVLWLIRRRAGDWFGWDRAASAGVGDRQRTTLRDRLPADLRDGPAGPRPREAAFSPLYLTRDEWAVEVVNQTVHAVVHFGWAGEPAGGYHGQLAVLTRPNGLFGAAYMAAINPFRYLIVYPDMIRRIGSAWQWSTPPAGVSAPPR
jgi:hypothetical protein